MNKNKKVYKFQQRKEFLISNPLCQSNPQPQPEQVVPLKVQKQTPTSSQFTHFSNVQPTIGDKLQIPKQMKIDNIMNRMKNKFVAMMDGEPLFKVDNLFENQVVCQVTGGSNKTNRESFGKKSKQNNIPSSDNNLQQEVEPQVFYQQAKFRPIQKTYQPERNYLQILSQGIPLHHVPLKQAFENSSTSQQQANFAQQMKEKNYINQKERYREKPGKMRSQTNFLFANSNKYQGNYASSQGTNDIFSFQSIM